MHYEETSNDKSATGGKKKEKKVEKKKEEFRPGHICRKTLGVVRRTHRVQQNIVFYIRWNILSEFYADVNKLSREDDK